MNPGDVITVRGVEYVVTRIRDDGEPCLTRVQPKRPGGYLDPL